MARNRNIIVQEFPTNCPNNRRLRMEISYDIGGANYFSGGSTPRGYHLHGQLYTKGNGFESFNPMDGYRNLIEEADRYSKKKLEEVAKNIFSNPLYKQVRDAVLAKSNLTIQEEKDSTPTPSKPNTSEELKEAQEEIAFS